MPHVIVTLWRKSDQQKVRLAQNITKDVMDVLHYREESVSVAFDEVEPGEWAAKVSARHRRQRCEALQKPGYTI
jgi:4-oxalocrotonate tautomerase